MNQELIEVKVAQALEGENLLGERYEYYEELTKKEEKLEMIENYANAIFDESISKEGAQLVYDYLETDFDGSTCERFHALELLKEKAQSLRS